MRQIAVEKSTYSVMCPSRMELMRLCSGKVSVATTMPSSEWPTQLPRRLGGLFG